MERDGFIFYRSFWYAVQQLPQKDQLPVIRAIISFGLDGTASEKLTATQNAFFLLCKPVLEKGRKKAANGKQGGSKRKANGKQNEADMQGASGLLLSKINDVKMKDERCKDVKMNDISKFDSEHLFSLFWEAYPERMRIGKEDAREAWDSAILDEGSANTVLSHLEAWKASSRWAANGGEYIPHPKNFLDKNREYLKTVPSSGIPKGASGTLGEAELDAIRSVLAEGGAE